MHALLKHLILLEDSVHLPDELKALVQKCGSKKVRIEAASFSFRTVLGAYANHSGMHELYGIDGTSKRNDIGKSLVLEALIKSLPSAAYLPVTIRSSLTLPLLGTPKLMEQTSRPLVIYPL